MCPGAARGPPGTDGAVGGGVGREGAGCEAEDVMACGRCLVRTFVGDWGVRRPPPLSLRMLVFRPSVKKKFVAELFGPGNGIGIDLVGERRVDDRAGLRWTCACARDG